jgi:hypothetical protein
MVKRAEEGVKSEGFFVMKEIGVATLLRGKCPDPKGC